MCKKAYDRITISNVIATYQVHLCWQQNKTHDFNFHARSEILGHKCFLEMHLTSKIHPNRVLPTQLAHSRVWHVSTMASLLCTMRRAFTGNEFWERFTSVGHGKQILVRFIMVFHKIMNFCYSSLWKRWVLICKYYCATWN